MIALTYFCSLSFTVGLNIITELPLWFSIFCVLIGLGYAWLLYRTKGLPEQYSRKEQKFLFVLRTLLVSVLAFLLLGPMLRTFRRQVEKPVILIAVDASSSVINTKDSTQIRNSIATLITGFEKKLAGDYDLRFYAFGDHVREGSDTLFTDKLTDFSQLYNTIDVNYANRNVGAIILASDGLYNRGESPVYGPSRVKVPVYSIALGDTSVRKDLSITRVNHNRIAFLGNSFPLEIVLDARQCAGAQVNLKIEEDSLEIFSKPILIAGNRFHSEIPVFPDAKKKGIRHYRITVTTLEGEVTASNNTRDIYVEIVENRQKILLVSAAPHPDIAALKNAIESSPNYEVTVQAEGNFTGNISGFNLVILHNIPSSTGIGNNVIKLVNDAGVPVWHILGAGTSVPLFNELNTGLNIQSPQPLRINDVQAVLDESFTLFTLSDELAQAITEWPPLHSPFGVYNTNGPVSTLFYQKIGNVNSRQPLLYFSSLKNKKTAVLTGEGLWKWKLTDFSMNGNDENFREIISKSVQYLIARENTSPFKVFSENSFGENEPLVFDAQLINPAGQPVNEPEARLIITNDEGRKFPFTFSRSGKNYTLNAGQFPSGRYSYIADVKLGDQQHRQSGAFTVHELQLESSTTIADHQVLYALSNRTGGFMASTDNGLSIADSLLTREDVKSVSFQEKKLAELINLPWVLFLLIATVSTEWFIRKRSGSY